MIDCMIGKRGGIARFFCVWSIIFVIFLIVTILIGSGYVVNFAEKQQKSISETLQSIQDNTKQQKYNHLTKFITSKHNFSDDFQESPLLITDNQVLFDQNIADNIELVYTNCNINTFNCEQVPRNYQLPLQEQFNLKNFQTIVKTKNQENKDILILIPKLSDDALLNILIFSTIPNDLQISQEINGEFYNVFKTVLKKKSPAITSKTEMIKLYLDGFFFQQIKESVLFYTEIGLKLGSLNSALEVAEEEYKYLPNNVNQKVEEYQQTIDFYYQKAQQALQKSKQQSKQEQSQNIQSLFGYGQDNTLVDKSLSKLFSKSDISKAFIELGLELGKLRQSTQENALNQAYQNRNAVESETSKLLRLKILQIHIAKILISSCEDETNRQSCLLNTLNCKSGDDVNNCVLNFIVKINSPSLCEHSRFIDQDQCYLEFSKIDSSFCARIRDDYLKSQCESGALVNGE